MKPMSRDDHIYRASEFVSNSGRAKCDAYDVVIRNGTMVDGSGSIAVSALDVAIVGGKIVGIGRMTGSARNKVIEAT